ncbi:MAG TPA: SpoIIE family protein phosphatase [Bryobacteraceae bacterium]|nr:SpoIIE family protein phosphatase [Bryobacteraceae bacterium]
MNAAASTSLIHELRPRIVERRARLQAAANSFSADYVNDLLAEVDAALDKIDNGTYGLCETCHDPIEADRLERNPLARFCLDHLTQEELRAHEQDLALATQIQATLLPARDIAVRDWQTHYRYEPAGVVGGDYCEIVAAPDGRSLFFAVGDVAGKGVAASLLMTHLSAIFRSLLSLDLPLTEVISRANRLFCESTPASHYATLVAGRAAENGVDLCNAGHCRPLLLRRDGTDRCDATGLPLGLFCDGPYTARHIQLDRGDSLVLFSDGITEAQDPEGNTYDEERLIRSLHTYGDRDPAAMAEGVLRDVDRFCGTRPRQDDITLLILRPRC